MVSILRLVGYFLKLGLIGFGGPPAHIALMRADVVDKFKWIMPEQFSDDLATANLIPGPTSTEMTIYIGYRLRGVPGAVVCGVCFILPAFLSVLALAVAYVNYGNLSQINALLYAIKPVALALVVYGTVQLGQPLLTGWREWALFAAALVVLYFFPQVDVLVVFLGAGLLLWVLNTEKRWSGGLAFFLLGTSAPLLVENVASALQVLFTFLKIGALIYGGGFALIGILQQEVVRNLGWLSQQQLLDAIAIGQATPGPVFTTATFGGYLVTGFPGAIAATVGIFAPAFVFVVVESKLLGAIKNKPAIKIFLRGVNIAVVASITLAAAQLGRDALIDLPTLLIAIASLTLLLRFKLDAHWLVLGGLVIGVVRMLIIGA